MSTAVIPLKSSYSLDDFASLHCHDVRYLAISSLDPCLAIGFYCRDSNDFDDFVGCCADINKGQPNAAIVHVADKPAPQICDGSFDYPDDFDEADPNVDAEEGKDFEHS